MEETAGNKNDALISAIAAACHQQNRLFCQSIGDNSQPLWEDLPQSIRQSTAAGVKAVLDEPDIKPDAMHQKWYDYKRAEGWSYGPEKNVDQKTHPNMLTFGDLPVQEQRKDIIFIEMVLQIAKTVGMIPNEPRK